MAEFEPRLAFEHIDKLAYEIGPRVSGTRGDKMAAEYIQKQFESHGLKTNVHEFRFVNRHARSKVTSCLFAAAFISSLLLSPAFSLVAWLVAISLWRSLGKLMPKRSSQNIIAIREVEAPKKRIALTAHYDSALCTVSYNLQLFLKFTFLPALAVVVAISALRAVGLMPLWQILWAVQAFFFLTICVGMFISASGKRASPGADDNASGTSVILEAARTLVEPPPPDVEPRTDVELRFIAFGAEEQGLLGARRLAKEKLLPQETLILNLDMVGAGSQAYIVEGNGLLRRSRTPEVLNKALEGSIQRVGLKPKYWWAALAGHDHIPLVKAGLHATTFSFDTPGSDRLGRRIARLFRLPNARVRGYRYIHTSDDIPDRIELEKVEQAGAIALDFVKTI